jgi:hypothetical protein
MCVVVLDEVRGERVLDQLELVIIIHVKNFWEECIYNTSNGTPPIEKKEKSNKPN